MYSRNKIKYTRISPLTKQKQAYNIAKFRKCTLDLFRRNKFMGPMTATMLAHTSSKIYVQEKDVINLC